MSKAPSMPLFCDAYLADTMHLSLEEHGAYLKLLMITWRNNGAPLPDDDARLARMLGITVGKWRKKLRPVLAPFFDLSEGTWKQGRLEKEWKSVQNFSEKQRENAQRRWGKLDGNSLENKDTGDATGMPEGMLPIPVPVREDVVVDARASGASSETDIPKAATVAADTPSGTDPTGEPARTVVAEFHKIRDRHWPTEVNFPAPELTLQSQAATVLAELPLATVLEVMAKESHRASDIGMTAPHSLKAYVHAFERAARARKGGFHVDGSGSTDQRASRGSGASGGRGRAGSIVAATRELLASSRLP